MSDFLTTSELARLYNIADWQARRAADALGNRVKRAGLYRLIPRSTLALVEAELRRRGWLPVEEVADA